VLLVDHDQPKAAEGQEKGGPGADDDPAAALGHGVPDLPTGGRSDPRVPFPRRRAEAVRHPGDQGLGQGDLRQEDQDLSVRVRPQGGPDRLQVDLRLAGPCDPVEEGGLESPLLKHRPQACGGGGLAVIEGRRRQVEVRSAEAIRAWGEPHLQGAIIDQAADDGGRDPGATGQVGGCRGALPGGLQHPGPRRREPGRGVTRENREALGARQGRPGAAQGDGQGQAGKLGGVASRPLNEVHCGRTEREGLEPARHRLERTVAASALPDRRHHPGGEASAQGDGDLLAHGQAETLRLFVVEGFR